MGQPDYNMRLSTARADSVFQWLLRAGIPQTRHNMFHTGPELIGDGDKSGRHVPPADQQNRFARLLQGTDFRVHLKPGYTRVRAADRNHLIANHGTHATAGQRLKGLRLGPPESPLPRSV